MVHSTVREPVFFDMLLTGEAAKVLNLSTGMVRKLADDGVLRVSKTATGRRLFLRRDVTELAAQRAKAARRP